MMALHKRRKLSEQNRPAGGALWGSRGPAEEKLSRDRSWQERAKLLLSQGLELARDLLVPRTPQLLDVRMPEEGEAGKSLAEPLIKGYEEQEKENSFEEVRASAAPRAPFPQRARFDVVHSGVARHHRAVARGPAHAAPAVDGLHPCHAAPGSHCRCVLSPSWAL
jgi:hypothetical protein